MLKLKKRETSKKERKIRKAQYLWTKREYSSPPAYYITRCSSIETLSMDHKEPME